MRFPSRRQRTESLKCITAGLELEVKGYTTSIISEGNKNKQINVLKAVVRAVFSFHAAQPDESNAPMCEARHRRTATS